MKDVYADFNLLIVSMGWLAVPMVISVVILICAKIWCGICCIIMAHSDDRNQIEVLRKKALRLIHIGFIPFAVEMTSYALFRDGRLVVITVVIVYLLCIYAMLRASLSFYYYLARRKLGAGPSQKP